MFRDFLGCFKMFQDVLGDQLQLIQTPFQKSNPKRNQKIAGVSTTPPPSQKIKPRVMDRFYVACAVFGGVLCINL